MKCSLKIHIANREEGVFKGFADSLVFNNYGPTHLETPFLPEDRTGPFFHFGDLRFALALLILFGITFFWTLSSFEDRLLKGSLVLRYNNF